MGKVTVKVKLTNYDDLALVRGGVKSWAQVREKEVEGLVDPGATTLILPEALVEELGIFVTDREVTVTYADGSRDKRKIGRRVLVAIEGREALSDCVIEKKGAQVLIGQVQLEEMDLVVDPNRGVLSPRPESPDMPMIEIYGMVVEKNPFAGWTLVAEAAVREEWIIERLVRLDTTSAKVCYESTKT